MNILQLIALALLGLVAASLFGLQNIQQFSWYTFLISSLLAIGLYASTYGINLTEARKHLKIIISAVTIGVLLKALIIGVSLALLFNDPFFIVLGVVVAQIDPLSVSSLLRGSRMSVKAKTILASWASFDDPMTVILALYAPFIVSTIIGDSSWLSGSSFADVSLVSYFKELGLNLGLALEAFCLYTVVRYYSSHIQAWLAFGVSVAIYAILAISFSLSIIYFMMLGIALIGLFIRPPIEKYLDKIVKGALVVASILLGTLLLNGVDILAGIALGVAAYTSQVIVGFALTRNLPYKDRWHIAFAQQNGITAIILALLFEPVHPGTIGIVAPAILVINSLHFLVNKIIDKYIFK